LCTQCAFDCRMDRPFAHVRLGARILVLQICAKEASFVQSYIHLRRGHALAVTSSSQCDVDRSLYVTGLVRIIDSQCAVYGNERTRWFRSQVRLGDRTRSRLSLRGWTRRLERLLLPRRLRHWEAPAPRQPRVRSSSHMTQRLAQHVHLLLPSQAGCGKLGADYPDSLRGFPPTAPGRFTMRSICSCVSGVNRLRTGCKWFTALTSLTGATVRVPSTSPFQSSAAGTSAEE
jgi:hypothetical protein